MGASPSHDGRRRTCHRGLHADLQHDRLICVRRHRRHGNDFRPNAAAWERRAGGNRREGSENARGGCSCVERVWVEGDGVVHDSVFRRTHSSYPFDVPIRRRRRSNNANVLEGYTGAHVITHTRPPAFPPLGCAFVFWLAIWLAIHEWF